MVLQHCFIFPSWHYPLTPILRWTLNSKKGFLFLQKTMSSFQWIMELRPIRTNEEKRTTSPLCVPKILCAYCFSYIKTCWDLLLLKLGNICSESRSLLSWACHCFWNSDSAELGLTVKRGTAIWDKPHRVASWWLRAPWCFPTADWLPPSDTDICT